MKKSKYESLKKSIDFLKAERREHHFKLRQLDRTVDDLVTAFKLRFSENELSPRIGTIAGETGAYQSGYVDGYNASRDVDEFEAHGDAEANEAKPNPQWLDVSQEYIKGHGVGYREGWNARTLHGSALGTMSLPLPRDHWLFEKNDDGSLPEMPAHLRWEKKHNNESIRNSLTAALKVAARGATCGGTDDDFDPDALVQNFFVALFGPAEEATAPIEEQQE